MLINLLTIVVFLLMFSVLVSVHEWGHYLFARLFKMKVSEFSIGMFQPVVKTISRRRYKLEDGEEAEVAFNIRAWPIGGFVKIEGMEPKEDGSEASINGGFYSKPAWQRILVLLAGPVFSIVFGWFVLVVLFAAIGTRVPNNQVATISKGLPADLAGILPGDRIIKYDGNTVGQSTDMIRAIRASKGQPITITLNREGQTLEKTMTPVLSKDEINEVDNNGELTEKKSRQLVLGLTFGSDYKPVPFGRALAVATSAPIDAVTSMIQGFQRPKQLIEESTGVIGMVATTKMAIESGTANVFMLTGLISISLGLFNLVPISMLDGGQIFLTLIEILRGGKRVSPKAQVQFIVAGMAVLLLFFVVVMYKDLFRFVIPGEQNVIQKPVNK